jgi:hypothetical protein
MKVHLSPCLNAFCTREVVSTDYTPFCRKCYREIPPHLRMALRVVLGCWRKAQREADCAWMAGVVLRNPHTLALSDLYDQIRSEVWDYDWEQAVGTGWSYKTKTYRPREYTDFDFSA